MYLLKPRDNAKTRRKLPWSLAKNVGEMDKTKILAMQGCRDTKKYEKYFGIPPMIGR